jgi:hypothetical protein
MFVASRSKFFGLAYTVLRNREDAKDALQDAVLSAQRNLCAFEGRSAFATWFTRIVLNAALMILRKRKSSRIDPFPVSSAAEDTPWEEKIPGPQPDPEMLYAEAETFQSIECAAEENESHTAAGIPADVLRRNVHRRRRNVTGGGAGHVQVARLPRPADSDSTAFSRCADERVRAIRVLEDRGISGNDGAVYFLSAGAGCLQTRRSCTRFFRHHDSRAFVPRTSERCGYCIQDAEFCWARVREAENREAVVLSGRTSACTSSPFWRSAQRSRRQRTSHVPPSVRSWP